MTLWDQLAKAREDDYYEKKEVTAELRQLRKAEIASELAHPQCCALAKKHIFPYRLVDIHKDVVLNNGVPVWKSIFDSGWGGEYDRRSMQITFCPFCGVKLPALRKKANPPEHIVIEDGRSNHCGGCKERFGMGYCWCSHPESAYEPVPV